LPVGTDVLDRRPGNRAWNACKALDARATIVDGELDKPIPIFTGCDLVDPTASETSKLLPPPSTNKGTLR
jgi:hypothetical protein